MQYTLVFTLIGSSLYAASLGGAINVSSGYRFDSITLAGKRFGIDREDKVTELKGWQNSIDGTLKINGFYLCGSAAYQRIFKNPKFYTTLAGIKESPQLLEKRYGFSTAGRFGYLFGLCSSNLYLGPELGFGLQRINTDRSAHEIAASPFAGFQILWRAYCEWSVALNFDFHFLGERRSRFVADAALPFQETSKGTYYGPEVRLSIDYSITDHWSMGVTSFFKYLKTTRCDLPSGYNATTEVWMNGGASLSAGYTF